MGNLFRRDYSRWWVPTADAAAAPINALLRADNLRPDDIGTASLRTGSAKVNSSAYADLDVHSLFSTHISGTRYRAAGAGDKVYVNDVVLDATFDGSGDISMGAAMGRLLMARGTSKKEYDGDEINNWSIAAPGVAPTLTALAAQTKIFATCDTGEAPAFSAEEGTITGVFPTGEDGTANGAIELTPAATGRATIRRDLAADTDYFNILGNVGSDFDLFDMSTWITNPQDVEKITVMVGVSPAAVDAFQTDYYYFDFELGGTGEQLTDPATTGAAVAVETAVQRESTITSGAQESDPETTEEPITDRDRSDIVDRVRQWLDENRPFRPDKAINPGWTHLACLRSQFKRVGTTTARDWTTVRSFKIVYKAVTGSTGTVRFDNAQMHGEGLTGSFRVVYRYARNCGDFWKLSPESPEPAEILVKGQRLQAVVPASEIAACDAQADEIWFYVYGGVLDRYYKSQTVTDIPRNGQGYSNIGIHEWNGADAGMSVEDMRRWVTRGFGVPAAIVAAGAVTVNIRANQADLLIANEFLEIGTAGPPDNILAPCGIIGEHEFRTFALTAKKLYPTLPRNPASFLPAKAIKVGDSTETAYWCAKTTGGVFVGTSLDIYLIEGDGIELADGTLNFSRRPLNINSPPVDGAVAQEGNRIIYRASDGWRTFDGLISTPVNKSDVELLYAGQTRHGVSAVNLSTGRFRGVLVSGVLTCLTPEGASTTSSATLHRVDFNKERWFRDTYPQAFRCLYREKDGTILAGDAAGFVWQLDTGTADGATAISPVLWTPVDDNALPMVRKDPYDVAVKLDTGGSSATFNLHLDGSSTTSSTFTASASGMLIYKRALKTSDDSGIAAFRQAQLRITGSFSAFKLWEWNLAYRDRPQTRMFVDTGYLDFGQHDLCWMREVILKAESPNDLTVKVWMDDSLKATKTVTVTANAAKPYTLRLGREVRGYQPRVTVETTNSAGTGEVGFEAYWVKFRIRGSGNRTEKDHLVNLLGNGE